jgi:NlpC/P60 family
MGDIWARSDRRVARSDVFYSEMACLAVVCVCLFASGPTLAQVAVPVHESNASSRLLSVEEGRSIVNVAWQQEQPVAGMRDCSHFVHQIYENAGFEYPYASSFEIYAGDGKFERVKNPHPGDVIAWPGHVGIVVDPLQHSFYSHVRTGLETQDYESAYWKSRGRPRFYRYKVEGGGIISAANAVGASRVSKGPAQRIGGAAIEERTTVENATTNRPPWAASEKRAAIYGPPAPPASPVSKSAETAFEIPTSVIVATGDKPPTREEVAEGISELSDALGSELRGNDPLRNERPVVIVEEFSVEGVDVKHDHGWAHLAVDSKVLIGGGAAQVKRRHEKVRWELRRTQLGWEAVTPSDRSYVPQDVAVKNLAANLARLTNSDGAAEHQEAVLRQESQLANLLNALLESKQDR